ncbi:aromatic prenyltransferase [Aaosphaeria arxii CBS 175.79]|uniref:Aromatic prenyltransferase n=1 Tax=Aaosphaeria arxii CBS 175.79 TaxID=1450172 RepID=A0A6A5XYY5_9PLEO|nr:aromatic prenyltransferase [Aaosphaeria arxii CBS 175.79]KAF2017911.1 aromatic prenyltransferase [Aaosphaeria arxii CBS 175.79]
MGHTFQHSHLPDPFGSALTQLTPRLFKFCTKLHYLSSTDWPSDSPVQCASRDDVPIKLLQKGDRESTLWWDTVGKLISLQLKQARYSETAQEKSLDFFQESVLPYMGSFPTHDSPRKWKSFMTDDHTPIELSWDWGNGIKAPRIRYSIDPNSLESGTPKDPTNLHAAKRYYEDVIKRIEGVNTTWHEHFTQCFDTFETSSRERTGRTSRVFYAFDVRENGDTIPKAYFFPRYLHTPTDPESSVWNTVTNAITSAPFASPDNLQALDVLSSFFKTEPRTTIEMLSIDLLDPKSSRVKIYFRSRSPDCASIAHNMTLGGRITDPTHLAGVRNLLNLWRRLFDLSEGEEVGEKAHETAGVLYYTDFRLGDAMPKIKIYIPVRHFARSDERVVEALLGHLEESRARGENMEAYSEVLRQSFSEKAMREESGVHTYLGCSIAADGSLQLISYINPQVHKMGV